MWPLHLFFLGLQAPDPAATPVEGLPLTGVEFPVPVAAGAEGARWPSLTAGADGELYLTFIESRAPRAAEGDPGGGSALAVARWVGERWERLADAAAGDDWFVNWADFPSLAALPDGALAAHFLVRSGGPHDYEARVALSRDGGASWAEPFCLHDDRRPAEHGFVSLEPWEEGFVAVWLDGRATIAGGPMALFARTIAVDGTLGPEVLLDERVCDCCQTAVAAAGSGMVVAYRDRSAEELRDVAWLSLGPEGLAGGPVALPLPLARDGWTIAGCPVNGPALASAEGALAGAWFTLGVDGHPRVQARRLRGKGADGHAARKWAPVVLSEEDPLGRVDAAFDPAGDLWVTWLEQRGESAEWIAARVDLEGGGFEPTPLVRVPSTGRDVGFGRLAQHGAWLYFAWTEPPREGRPATVRTLRF